jgi:hypothetical protein
MPEVAPSSIKAPGGDDAGRPIGVSLISAVKTVLSLLSADVDSEERLFRAVTSSLAELSLRGSVMLREGDSSVLRSGYLDDKNRQAEINGSEWAFLPKPFNSDELLTSLRALISP